MNSADITMGGPGFDTGIWKAIVLSPGRDGTYGSGALGIGAGQLADSERVRNLLVGKNQEQIVAILMDHTVDVVGSDDKLSASTFTVQSGYVELKSIATVAIGEPLNVSGKTNREPETLITISTFAGPVELPAEVVEIKWPTADVGVFNATIDTTDAEVGTYTFEADDGEGHTDRATSEIVVAAPTPTTLTRHAPISIFGNDNFIAENGVTSGSGTQADLYIIKKLGDKCEHSKRD